MNSRSSNTSRWICCKCGYDLTVPTGDVCPECGTGLVTARIRPLGRPHGLIILAGVLAAIEFLALAILCGFLVFSIWRDYMNPVGSAAAAAAMAFFAAAFVSLMLGYFRDRSAETWFALLAVMILLFIIVFVGVVIGLTGDVLQAAVGATWFLVPNAGIALALWIRYRELRALGR